MIQGLWRVGMSSINTTSLHGKIPRMVKCLLSHDRSTGLWIGHCLDFDIITSAPTEEKVWEALKHVVVVHIESCLADDFPEGLAKIAPPEAWIAFIDEFMSSVTRNELIEFKLKRKNQTQSVWLRGVGIESLPAGVPAFA